MSFPKFTNAGIAKTLLLIGLLASNGAWANAGSVLNLLQQMSQAGDRLNYSGEFVYVSEGKISSMKIMHMRATETTGSQQKLMALDGSMREIIQQDDIVACVLPDQNMGVREKRRSRQLFRIDLGPELEQIRQYYDITLQQPDRIANRDCDRLRVEPKDEYRYGYSLCIDTETRLLLSSELFSTGGDVLESYRFISVQFDAVEDSDLHSQTPPQSLDWMDDKQEHTGNEQTEPSIDWQVMDNPSGFKQAHYINRVSPVLQSDIVHLVLSDGLAQVSVFILPAALSTYAAGTTLSMGSLNSYSRLMDEHMVTVVGEVPGVTVQLVAEKTQLLPK